MGIDCAAFGGDSVFHKLGYEPEFQIIPWSEKNQYLADGTIDCIWSCYSMNDREASLNTNFLIREIGKRLNSTLCADCNHLATVQIWSSPLIATTRAAELFLHKIDSSLPEVKQVNCFATTEDLFASIRKGYVEAVEDGTDAVERMETVEASRYDLILMDIQMPKMDGYTAAREIRTLRDNQKANITIVAVTANAFEEDKKKAFESGMNGHISKPINREAIMRMLDQIFGQEITTDEGETEGENR